MESKQNFSKEEARGDGLREKLRGMTPMQKFEYIMTYYWMHILLVIFLLLALRWGSQWVGRLQQNTVFYAAVMDAACSQEEAETFAAGFVDTLPETGKHDVMQIDTSLIYLSPEQSGTQLYNSYLDKELILETTGLDVYLTPKEFYEENRENEDLFLSLREVLGEDYALYEDSVLDDTALVLEDCRLTRAGMVSYSPVYLTVPAGAEHPELVADFIHYLTGE